MNKQDTQGCVANVRAYLAGIGSPISASQGYEVVARSMGLKNKHVLASATTASTSTATAGKSEQTAKAIKTPIIFTGDQPAYTVPEMAAMNWTFDVVIPMSMSSMGNVDNMNDAASLAIIGKDYGLQGIGFEVYNHFYGNDAVAVRVTGCVSEPEDIFDYYPEEDSVPSDDVIAEWVGLHYRQDFSHSSEDQKASWRVRYTEMHPGE